MTIVIIIAAVIVVLIILVLVIITLSKEVKFLNSQNTSLRSDNIIKKIQLEVLSETKGKLDAIQAEEKPESLDTPVSGDSVSRLERLNRMQNSSRRHT